MIGEEEKMKIKCDKCEKFLKEQGALIFSPPSEDRHEVIKLHICKECYELKLLEWLSEC